MHPEALHVGLVGHIPLNPHPGPLGPGLEPGDRDRGHDVRADARGDHISACVVVGSPYVDARVQRPRHQHVVLHRRQPHMVSRVPEVMVVTDRTADLLAHALRGLEAQPPVGRPGPVRLHPHRAFGLLPPVVPRHVHAALAIDRHLGHGVVVARRVVVHPHLRRPRLPAVARRHQHHVPLVLRRLGGVDHVLAQPHLPGGVREHRPGGRQQVVRVAVGRQRPDHRPGRRTAVLHQS